MTTKPRFTLRAILGCTAALCVPLVIGVEDPLTGLFVGIPIVGGCIGYLIRGRDGAGVGLLLAGVEFLAWAIVQALWFASRGL